MFDLRPFPTLACVLPAHRCQGLLRCGQRKLRLSGLQEAQLHALIHNYLGNPPEGFRRNGFQLTAGITYVVKWASGYHRAKAAVGVASTTSYRGCSSRGCSSE